MTKSSGYLQVVENLCGQPKNPFLRLIIHIFPGAISILQIQSLDVFMYTQTPLSRSPFYLLMWVVAQGAIGIWYAKISDKNRRKIVLVVVQILGLVVCSVLYFIGHTNFIPVVLVAMFNPLPIAKATLLDNFPSISPLRLIGMTYLFQFAPWAFFNQIKSANPVLFLSFQVIILSINIILTIFFVKDKYKINHQISHHRIPKRETQGTLKGFFFAESAFYLAMTMLEYNHALRRWFSPTNIATILGVSIVMFYSRITHMSVITLAYFSCFACTVLGNFVFYLISSDIAMISVSFASVLGGLYLPLVTDAMILFYGNKRKAFATSIVEFVDSLSRAFGTSIPVIATLAGLKIGVNITLFLMSGFFLTSALIQKYIARDEG